MNIHGKRSLAVLAAAILAVQMIFASGIMVFSDDTETEIIPTDSGVEINGLNLVLSGEIGLTFHVYVPRKYRSGTMVLEFMGEKTSPAIINECPQDSDYRYTATYYLSAIELSEPVTLTVYDADGNPLARKTRSAEDYINQLLDEGGATDKEKNIAETLINYGHYAQLACSEAKGWVIGEDYAETTEFYAPTVDTAVFDKYEIDWLNPTEALPQFSMSLRLDYKTGIHLYLPLDEKPAVTVNGEAAEVIEIDRSGNKYEIFIEGINALNLEDEYEITVNDVTFTLSAFSYCHLAASYNSSANTIDAMRALYEFYQAIVAYNSPEEV